MADQSLLDAIKGFEGYSETPYFDYKQTTSGYGTKAQPGDADIPMDQRQAVYQGRLENEVNNAQSSVDSFAPNLPPGVRAALTSLTYNAGPGWQQSGLGQAVKAGDYDQAKNLFLQYNHAGGQVNPALTERRQQEATWFGGGLPAASQTASLNSPAPANVPLQVAQQAPIFPQAAPQQVAQGGATPSSFAPPQAPPIFYAPRRPIDISGLQAAFGSPFLFKGQA